MEMIIGGLLGYLIRPPFYTISYLPGSFELTGLVNKETVTFHLFTKNSNTNNTILTAENSEALKNADKIVFIIHGWQESNETYWYPILTNAYLQRKDYDYSVIQVNWKIPANLYYLLSSKKVEPVGDFLGEFILNVTKKYNINLDKFEISGHSLGAHIAAFAGKKIINETGEKIPRITALDPAGPLFPLDGDPEKMLTKNDAKVVVAIHTCGGLFGHLESCGTVDLYFNGGTPIQPGCPDDLSNTLFVLCSHHRSFRFFIEALETGKFYGLKCDNYEKFQKGECNATKDIINLGGNITEEFKGNYYADTNSKPQFARNYI